MLPDHWRFVTIKVYYRLCDKQPRINHPAITWEKCLKNAIKIFGTDNLHMMCDNCEQSTIDYVNEHVKPASVEITNLGNSPSFNYMVDKILKECKDTDIVYMLESDYLHTPESKMGLLDGLNYGDYVTLYDSPDMYQIYSPNFTVKNGGSKCTLYCGITSHWRTIPSTTMTFATNVKTLRDDYDIIMAHTKQSPPSDFEMFLKLGTTRTLVCPIPSMSTHGARNYIARLRNWDDVM